VHAPLLEDVGDHRPAEGAVALPDDELGRVPAAVAAQPRRDELREGVGVGVNAVEVLLGSLPRDAAETGAHRVDEHQVGPMQQRLAVVDDRIRRRRRVLTVRRHDPLRPDRSHVQPHRCRPRAAVEQERHRPGAPVGKIAPHVGHGVHQPGQFAFVVLDGGRPDVRAVGDRVAAHLDRAARRRPFLLGFVRPPPGVRGGFLCTERKGATDNDRDGRGDDDDLTHGEPREVSQTGRLYGVLQAGCRDFVNQPPFSIRPSL
jgi:hypothetical protein